MLKGLVHMIAMALLLLVFTSGSRAEHHDILIIGSTDDFNVTTARLEAEIKKRGIQIFAVIDHAAGAQSIGEELPPSKTYIIGNPKLGTPLMQQYAYAALDLPLRISVVRDHGKIFVVYREPDTIAKTWHMDPQPPQIEVASKVLNELANIAAGRHLVDAPFAQ